MNQHEFWTVIFGQTTPAQALFAYCLIDKSAAEIRAFLEDSVLLGRAQGADFSGVLVDGLIELITEELCAAQAEARKA